MGKTSNWVARLTAGALLASATTVVTINEGYKEKAYKDGAGVATICYGETKGVSMGMVMTRSQCDSQLQNSLKFYAKVLDDISDEIPDVVALGSLDMAYNVGVAGFNNSEAKRWIKAGDYTKAGQAVLQWKYITVNGRKFDCSVKGNKICYGLWKRRLIQSEMIGNKISVEEALQKLRTQ